MSEHDEFGTTEVRKQATIQYSNLPTIVTLVDELAVVGNRRQISATRWSFPTVHGNGERVTVATAVKDVGGGAMLVFPANDKVALYW